MLSAISCCAGQFYNRKRHSYWPWLDIIGSGNGLVPMSILIWCKSIWVRLWMCACLVTWFCYQMIAKPGNRTSPSSCPDPFAFWEVVQTRFLTQAAALLLSICSLRTSHLHDEWQKYTERTSINSPYMFQPISSYDPDNLRKKINEPVVSFPFSFTIEDVVTLVAITQTIILLIQF